MEKLTKEEIKKILEKYNSVEIIDDSTENRFGYCLTETFQKKGNKWIIIYGSSSSMYRCHLCGGWHTEDECHREDYEEISTNELVDIIYNIDGDPDYFWSPSNE